MVRRTGDAVVTRLPGDKPDRQKNFHGADGRHLFPHPGSYHVRKAEWTAWDRRYAAHLDRHKELIENPEPVEGDTPAVTALFEHIAHLEQIVKKEKQLIVALRQRAALYPEADESEAERRVVRTLREGGIGS